MTRRYYPPSLPTTQYDPIPQQAKTTYEDYKKIKSFNDVGFFLQSYVNTGGEVTRDATYNNVINVTAISASLGDNVLAREATSFRTSTPSTTYYLDFTVAGDWNWGTAHPAGVVGTDYLSIAEVTTDALGNVEQITDNRGRVGGFKLKDEFGLQDYATGAQVTGMTLNVKFPPYPLNPLNGDGTDDTALLQAIVNYCSANNIKKILFPQGAYFFEGTVNITSWDMEFEGVGLRSTNLRKLNAGFMFNVNLSSGPGGWRGVSFKNMSFLGDASKLSSVAKFHFVQQGLFENCNFANFKHAALLTGNTHYTKFLRCRFVEITDPIYNPDSSDPDYVVGNSNNNIIDHCFFTYCGRPIYQGDGAEWTVRDTDFEGYNGTIEINRNNNFINVRIERNLSESVWLRVNGDGNTLEFSLHGTGNITEEWRVKVHGRFNNLKIYAGFNVWPLLDLGGSNSFNVLVNRIASTYENLSNTYMVRKDSSFVMNRIESNVRYRNKAYSTNYIRSNGTATGATTDTIKEDVNGNDVFFNNVPTNYTYGFEPINRTSPRYVFFAIDIYTEDTVDQDTTDQIYVRGPAVAQFRGYRTNAWYRAVMACLANSSATIFPQAQKNASMGSKRVAFANPQLSVDAPPADLPYNTLTPTKSIT